MTLEISLPKIQLPSMRRRKSEPKPCESEIIPLGDWCIVALPQGVFEGILVWKQPEWGRAGVLIEVSFHGELYTKQVSVWEANIRRMSCWLDDAECAPHLVDNYLW